MTHWTELPPDILKEWQAEKRRAIALTRSQSPATLEVLERQFGHRTAVRVAWRLEQRRRARKKVPPVSAEPLSDEPVGLYSARKKPKLIRPGLGQIVSVD
jgi:hypothetical protein